MKPASEPIIVARKPLDGTVAANVLAHGTGAINIDGCRVGWDAESLARDTARRQAPRTSIVGGRLMAGTAGGFAGESASPSGRWPSNVVFAHAVECGPDDTTPCVDGCPVAELDARSAGTRAAKPSSGGKGPAGARTKNGAVYGAFSEPEAGGWSGAGGYGDSGSASRFFPTFRYQAKASTRERPRVGGIAHPTVKPVDLMRWLVRLVTPPGGLILDPFAGSGTTIEAALLEGFQAVGIELDPAHVPLIVDRVTKHVDPVERLTRQRDAGDDVDLGLFEFLADDLT